MSIPDALRTELGRYLIGEKLRALRLRRSMGLAQLSELTGLSPALLSKIENDRLVPTLPTLLRIAIAFDVTLDHFFQNEIRRRVVSITRKGDRERSVAPNPSGNDCYHLKRLDLGYGDRKFQPYLAEFFPETATNGKPHMHQGVEFIHLLYGQLQMVIGAETHLLGPGDSIYFDSGLRHSYKRLGDQHCIGFMVFAYAEKNVAERRMDRLEAVRRPRTRAEPASVAPEPARQPSTNGNGAAQSLKTHRQPA